MKYALFIVHLLSSGHDPVAPPDLWWAVAGNMTHAECLAELERRRPAFETLYGARSGVYMDCDEDHAPGEW